MGGWKTGKDMLEEYSAEDAYDRLMVESARQYQFGIYETSYHLANAAVWMVTVCGCSPMHVRWAHACSEVVRRKIEWG